MEKDSLSIQQIYSREFSIGRGSNPGVLENVEYSFIAITPRPGVVVPVKVQSQSNRISVQGMIVNCIW